MRYATTTVTAIAFTQLNSLIVFMAWLLAREAGYEPLLDDHHDDPHKEHHGHRVPDEAVTEAVVEYQDGQTPAGVARASFRTHVYWVHHV